MIKSAFPSVVPNRLMVAGDTLDVGCGGGVSDSHLYCYDGNDLLPIRRSTHPGMWGFNPFEPTTMGGDLYFTDGTTAAVASRCAGNSIAAEPTALVWFSPHPS